MATFLPIQNSLNNDHHYFTFFSKKYQIKEKDLKIPIRFRTAPVMEKPETLPSFRNPYGGEDDEPFQNS